MLRLRWRLQSFPSIGKFTTKMKNLRKKIEGLGLAALIAAAPVFAAKPQECEDVISGNTGVQIETRIDRPMYGSYTNSDYPGEAECYTDKGNEKITPQAFQIKLRSKAFGKGIIDAEIKRDSIFMEDNSRGGQCTGSYTDVFQRESKGNYDETAASFVFSNQIKFREIEGEIGAGPAILSGRIDYSGNSSGRFAETYPADENHRVYIKEEASRFSDGSDKNCSGISFRLKSDSLIPFEINYTSLEGKLYEHSNSASKGSYSDRLYDEHYDNIISEDYSDFDWTNTENYGYSAKISERELVVPFKHDDISVRVSYKNISEEVLPLTGYAFESRKSKKEIYGAQIRYNHNSFILGADYSFINDSESISSDCCGSNNSTASYDRFGLILGYKWIEKNKGDEK